MDFQLIYYWNEMVLAIYSKVEDIKGQGLIFVEETPSFGCYSSSEQMKTHHLRTLF